MKSMRTNYKGLLISSGESDKATWPEFLAANRLLLVYTVIFLSGTLLGMIIYMVSKSVIADDLSTILEIHKIAGGFSGVISALCSSCFSTILLLAFLYLTGLSACGAPFAVLVPLFYGLGLGLSEAYYYSQGMTGLFIAALLVAPHCLIAAVALVLGSMESVRMSLLFSKQLLPNGILGGLWMDYKLFTSRFLVFLCMAFASGILDVCMRLIFASLFI